MHLISFLMYVKFGGNPITHLHFMVVFCKYAKRKRRKKTWVFEGLLFQEHLVRFASDLVCVLSQNASTYRTNSVVFGQETMELQMHEKLYFGLHVNILTSCSHTPFSWATRHTTVCLDGIINVYSSVATFNNIIFSSDAQFMMFWSS